MNHKKQRARDGNKAYHLRHLDRPLTDGERKWLDGYEATLRKGRGRSAKARVDNNSSMGPLETSPPESEFSGSDVVGESGSGPPPLLLSSGAPAPQSDEAPKEAAPPTGKTPEQLYAEGQALAIVVYTRANEYNRLHGGWTLPEPLIQLGAHCVGECFKKYPWLAFSDRYPEAGAIGIGLATCGQTGWLWSQERKKQRAKVEAQKVRPGPAPATAASSASSPKPPADEPGSADSAPPPANGQTKALQRIPQALPFVRSDGVIGTPGAPIDGGG